MNIYGVIASSVSILAVSGGLVIQIHKIIKLKQSHQLSISWMILSIITWSSWIVYGWSINDFYILLSNGIGCILQTVLLVVALKYNKK